MSEQNPTLSLEPQAFSRQSQQFWTLLISGWLGYAVVVFIAIIRPQFDSPNFNFTGQLLNLLVETGTGFLLCYVQWQFIRSIVPNFSLRTTLFFSFVSAAILGGLFNVVKLASYKILVHHQQWYAQWNMLEFGGWFLFSLTTLFVWTSIFFIMLYNTKLQKEHEMLLRAQTAAKEAQLQMLRYQLNPHFMFNTMNAISTLILKKDNDKAADMLDKLSDFFRYSLETKSETNTTLAKELTLLDLYLAIEHVRFANKMQLKIKIDEACTQAIVPCLLLQPLVENAIKYGIELSKSQGLIEIEIQLNQGRLIIDIIDSGDRQLVDASKGFGIGLANTKERLANLFNDDFDLTIEQQPERTKVQLNLPFKLEAKS